ncbi:hypothetical protein REPUB_Repub05bG0020500 [Reevesia pubescens]
MMSGGRPQLLLLLFIALFYLLLLQEISTKAELIKCKESERQALLEFKQSLKPIIQPMTIAYSLHGTQRIVVNGRVWCATSAEAMLKSSILETPSGL